MRTTPTLSARADRVFEIRWSEQTAKGWRSMRKSTRTADRGEAEMALGRFLNDRTAVDPAINHKVAAVLDAYLRDYALPRGIDKTEALCLRAPRLAFGWRDPHTLTQADIDDFSRDRQRGLHGKVQVKPQTVRREVSSLQAALNYGSHKRLMVRGKPIFRFEKPAPGLRRDLWLDEAQERDILARLPEASLSVQAFTRMGLTYAVRRGAMLELRFGPQVSFISSAIDFKVPGRRVTHKRRPVSPMTAAIRPILEALFEQRGAGAFVLDRSTPHDFKLFMAAIGYGWVTPHTLKHTGITLMLRGGANLRDVSNATATNINTLMTVYQHHTVDELLSTVETRRG